MRFRTLLASALLVLPTAALAISSTQTDQSVVLEQAGDRYEIGNGVSLAAPFTGDMFGLGQTVTIDEPVSGSLQVAGQTVIINTTVGGNLRVAGQTIIIRGTVKGSVLAMGADITVQEGAKIDHDLTVFGDKATVNGSVGGSLFSRARETTLNGAVTQSVDMGGDKVTFNNTIGGNATVAAHHIVMTSTSANIDGNLVYWSENEGMDFSKNVRGTVTLDPTLKPKGEPGPHGPEAAGALALLAGAVGLYAILASAFALLIFLPLLKKTFMESAKTLQKNPWQSIGVTILYFVGLPIIAVLLMITVVGIPLALLVGLKFVAGLVLARLFASVVLVRWLELHRKAKWGNWFVGFLAILTYIALHLINVIPVVGWLVSTALIAMGFGAFVLTMYEKMQKVL